MKDNAGNIFMLNGIPEPSESLGEIDGTKSIVYEVIRIIERVPLFLEDHYARLRNSLELLKTRLEFARQELKLQIQRLVDANELSNCNVKVIVFNEPGRQNCLMYICKSYYPDAEETGKGVKVGLMHWERSNPNVKLENLTYKEQAAKKMAESKAFEVLLVNSQSRITEGSKSNVFFVKGKKVFTAPDEYVLKGVTRQYIIDICTRSGFEVVETLVGVDSLKEMEGLFISGTSIKVLPISYIDDTKYNSSTHPVIDTIKRQYDSMLQEYVQANS